MIVHPIVGLLVDHGDFSSGFFHVLFEFYRILLSSRQNPPKVASSISSSQSSSSTKSMIAIHDCTVSVPKKQPPPKLLRLFKGQPSVGLEKYVMKKLFSRTFTSILEDVKIDHDILEKICLLQSFLRPEHLDIPAVLQNEASWLVIGKMVVKTLLLIGKSHQA